MLSDTSEDKPGADELLLIDLSGASIHELLKGDNEALNQSL